MLQDVISNGNFKDKKNQNLSVEQKEILEKIKNNAGGIYDKIVADGRYKKDIDNESFVSIFKTVCKDTKIYLDNGLSDIMFLNKDQEVFSNFLLSFANNFLNKTKEIEKKYSLKPVNIIKDRNDMLYSEYILDEERFNKK